MDLGVTSPVDLGLAHVTPAGKLSFSAETYLGNWYEETVRNTFHREEFVRKRECEELAIQKSQVMVDILLKPVQLPARPNGYLYFGDSAQIICPGPTCKTAAQEHPFKNYCHLTHLAISASVLPTVVDNKPFLDTDSVISASPHLFPVVRNSFVLERPDCPEDNKTVIKFGDVFRIRAMPTQQFPLYLHSSPAIPLHTASFHSGKPLVRFSDTKNPNTLWRIMPLDELTKIKMGLGVPVPLQRRVYIQHALSGNNLSIEPDYPVLTYFGCEQEVTVHTKYDRVRRPLWSNHWSFSTERGWLKPDPELLCQAKYSASINANDVTSTATDNSADAGTEDQEPPCDEYDYTQDQMPQQTVYQFAEEQKAKEMAAKRIETGVPGHILPYDYRTGPQPNAHLYKLGESRDFFPNKKWTCDGTECCYPRPPNSQAQIVCPPEPECFPIEGGKPRCRPPPQQNF